MGEFATGLQSSHSKVNMKSFAVLALLAVAGISAFDMDQSGGLSREEVGTALEAEHGEIDPETVDPAVVQLFDGIFDHFDADKDGEITMKELRKAAKMAKKHLKAVFDHCDADQSGKLSGEEMLNAMMEEFELDFNHFSQDLQDTLTDMYNDMDVDEDGEISFKELKGAVKYMIQGIKGWLMASETTGPAGRR